MIAEQVALYLHTLGQGVQSVDLFFGFQPNTPDDCIVVYDVSASGSPDSQALSVDEFGIQILVRNTVYSEARNKSMAIHKVLVGFGGRPFLSGGPTVHMVFVDTTPTSIGRDDKDRNEWSSHYRVRVESEGDLFRN